MATSIYVSLLACALLALTSGQTIDEIIAGSSETVEDFDFMSDVNGEVIRHELDMMLTIDQYKDLTGMPADTPFHDLLREKRKAIKWERYRWADKVIPYKLASGVFSPRDRTQIQAAINEWEQYTCLSFRPAHRNDENFVYFDNGSGCYSYVGMSGGSQTIGLAGGCRQKGVIVHEIGHAVGFHHEQNRPDRDSYVRIMEQNIPQKVRYNFRKYSWAAVDTFNVPYDYSSVMHYGGRAFTHNGDYTIRTLDPAAQRLIGNRQGLSFYDIMLANRMYKCSEGCDKNIRCPRDAFLGKDCKCYCKGNPVRQCDDTTVTDNPRVTPTTTTPRPTRRPDCRDMNENCRAWAAASANYCQTNTYVKTYCRASCQTCDGEDKEDTCKDQREHCTFWKDKGFCTGVYEDAMRNLCPKTCRHCSPRAVSHMGENSSSRTAPVASLIVIVGIVVKLLLD